MRLIICSLVCLTSLISAEVPADTKNVVLITLDTLRADHLSCYGYEHQVSPGLDQIAEEGVVFTRAFTPYPLTLPAHVCILTGTNSYTTLVRRNILNSLSPEFPTLATILKEKKYSTKAIIAANVLSHEFGLSRGFDLYDDRIPPEVIERRADEITDLAIRNLKGIKPPFFTWIHYYDPHYPYDAPGAACEKLSDYDAEIAFMDREIGKLFRFMEKEPWFQETLFVIVGDHGEGLGDHGEETHGFLLYNSTLHVPLIFYAPGTGLKGRVDVSVSTASITPTVLEMLGIDSKKIQFDVPSLSGLIRGEKVSTPWVYAETYNPYISFLWSPIRTVLNNQFKLIHAPEIELYDLRNDFHEKVDLSANRASLAKKIFNKFKLFSTDPWGEMKESFSQEVSDELIASLESLGYLQGGQQRASRADFSKLPNPRDLADLTFPLTITSQELLDGERFQEVADLMVGILRRDRSNPFALFTLGRAYAELENYELALRAFLKAEKNQKDYDIYEYIGTCYHHTGNRKKAMEYYLRSYELNRKNIQVVNNLIDQYLLAGDLKQAGNLFKAARRDGLKNSTLSVLGGRIALLNKDYSKALDYFKESTVIDPENAYGYGNMGEIYFRLGRLPESIKYLKVALEKKPGEPIFYKFLANLYLRSGKKAKAIQVLEEYLDRFPNDPGNSSLRKQLDELKS